MSGGLSGAAAPGGGPKYTHASKERRGRQKERRTKKERVRHVEKGTKGFEHASGQRPGEYQGVESLDASNPFQKMCDLLTFSAL